MNIDAQGSPSLNAYVLSVLVMNPYGQLVQVGGYDRKFNSENVMSVGWVDNWYQVGSANQNGTRNVTTANLHDYEGAGSDVTSNQPKRRLESIEKELVRTINALRRSRSTLKGSKDGSHFSARDKEKIAVSLNKPAMNAAMKTHGVAVNQAYAECGVYYSYSYSSSVLSSHDYSYKYSASAFSSHDYSYSVSPYTNCTNNPEWSPDGKMPSFNYDSNINIS